MEDKALSTKPNQPTFREQLKIRRKTLISIIILVVLGFVVFRVVTTSINNKPEDISDVINIKVTTAQITTLENTVPLSGRINAVEEVSILPKMPGQVAHVYVALGDKITKGKVIFDLDKAQMSSAFNQANEVYLNAKVNYERMQILYQEGAVSRQQFEQVKMQYETSRQSQILANDALSNTSVTSPIGGFVTSLNVVPGGMASQAMPSATIADISQVEINSAVSESLINKIKVGDKVKVFVQSVSDQPFIGTITALSPAPASGSLTYPLKITIDNSDTAIKPGMSAEIIITSDKTENALVVPSNAIMIKGGKTVVALIEANTKVILTEVTLGIDNGIDVQIKTGLSSGDQVVISGQQYLYDSSIINIVE